MKTNPLFVDSTKFHGDMINTQIELRRVILHDNESLSVIVFNHQGVRTRLAMKPLDESTFEARMHLNHQKPITYQFVIEKDELPVYMSTFYKGRALYAVIADWEPCFDPIEEPKIQPLESERPKVQKSPPQSRSDTWSSLMDKWGL